MNGAASGGDREALLPKSGVSDNGVYSSFDAKNGGSDSVTRRSSTVKSNGGVNGLSSLRTGGAKGLQSVSHSFKHHSDYREMKRLFLLAEKDENRVSFEDAKLMLIPMGVQMTEAEFYSMLYAQPYHGIHALHHIASHVVS